MMKRLTIHLFGFTISMMKVFLMTWIFFPKEVHGGPNIRLFGSEQGNCLEVLMESGKIASVSLRIDFSKDFHTLLNRIILYCVKRGLVLVDENLYVLPNEVDEIIKIIVGSPQHGRLNEINRDQKNPDSDKL
jgi:hypothetical protein